MGYLLILIIIIIPLIYNLSLKNKLELTKRTNKPKIGVFIPARDESKVIKGLLDSLTKQSYEINMSDVYIIVEDNNDPTIKIASDYNAKIFKRTNLENRRRKGYALDECIKEVLKTKEYDMYFVFDADNILDQSYFENMLPYYYDGYDIVTGYRNTKNGDDSVIAGSSSLTFSLINSFSNKLKLIKKSTMTISGTGFYMSREFVNKVKGYPFYSLTEDYELALYANLNNIPTMYNESSILYDEQANSFKDTIKQRTRWIKGYFDSRKKYIPLIRKNYKKASNKCSLFSEILGVNLVILLIVLVLGYTTYLILTKSIYILFYALAIIYLILMLFTIMLLLIENNKINLNKKSKLKLIFFNPIYLISYIIPFIKSLTLKEVIWDKIEHNVNEVK